MSAILKQRAEPTRPPSTDSFTEVRILDPILCDQVIRERRERGLDRRDEVWDGVYVIMPEPNLERQTIVGT
jgi:hypothetical protein